MFIQAKNKKKVVRLNLQIYQKWLKILHLKFLNLIATSVFSKELFTKK